MYKKLITLVISTVVLFFVFSGCSQECPACPECEGNVFEMSFQEGILPSSAYDGGYDAYINSSNPNDIYVDCSLHNLGVTGGVNRVAVFFDVTAIPATAVVVKAYLTLTTQLLADGYNFTAYRQEEFWWDGTGGCGTVGVSAYDPDWNGPWDTAGGILTSAVGTASSSTGVRALTFELTIVMVQDWITNGVSAQSDGNFGVIIKKDSESSGYLTIHSNESATVNFRPLLTVYYS